MLHLDKPVVSPENAVIVSALKKRYFELISKEEIGSTPQITAEADQLETAIKKMTSKEKG